MSNALNLAERRFFERMRAAEPDGCRTLASEFALKLAEDCDKATATGLTYGAVLASLAATFKVLALDAKEEPGIAFSTFLKFDAQARADKNRAQRKLPPPGKPLEPT